MKGLRKLCKKCHTKFLTTLARVVRNTGETVCPDCARDYTYECHHCHNLYTLTSGEFIVGEHRYCGDCHRQLFATCNACGVLMERSSAMSGRDGRDYCNECFESRFIICEDCGRVIWRDDVQNVEGRRLCIRCKEQSGRVIKEYSYSPAKLNFGKLAWENTTFLGLELEVECNGDNWNEQATEFKNYLKELNCDKQFFFKEDGSVQGYEIVSHPFTLQYAHKNIQFKKMLEFLSEKKYSSYNNGHCGLHIHIGRDGLTDNDVIKMRAFFSKNAQAIQKFSNRNGRGQSYCEFESFRKSDFLEHYQDGRYWALNLNTRSKKTVEMRVFRGTLNYERFLASLQFADAVVNFVKVTGIGKLLTQWTWQDFKEFVNRQGSYKKLAEYIKKKQL